MKVWGHLWFYSFQVILLEPVHNGRKVEDRGLPIRLAHELPQFPSKKTIIVLKPLDGSVGYFMV
jgi:hypothetical protein